MIKLLIITLIVLCGCCKIHSNQEIILETKKCLNSGLRAVWLSNGLVGRIECRPYIDLDAPVVASD